MPQSAKGCGFARGSGWRFRRSGHDTRVPACRFFPAARRKRARAFALNRLEYRSALDDERDLPAWGDEALRKALLINPAKRYGELSEFVADLRRQNREFMIRARPPLIERNPVAFWKGLSLILAVTVIVLVWVIRART